MNNFIHLHLHSDYSPQDGACTVDSIAKKAKELGMESVALTDHGRAGGLLQFKKACDKHGVRPIYGVELYMCPPGSSRTLREKIEGYKTSYHLVALAKNEEGLKNIFRLTSTGWKDGIYYKPRIDIKALREFSEGVIILSACAGGFIPNMLMEEREEEAVEFGETMRDIFGDDFYVEVQDHGINWQRPLKYKLFDFAAKYGYKIVATQDSHFIEEKDADLHAKICKLAAGDLEFESKELYFKTYDEMCKRFEPEHRHALDMTYEIADKCRVDWNFGDTIWPVYELEGTTPSEELQKKTEEGFKEKIITAIPEDRHQEYRERISYELGVINRMGFPTYFLVVADFIGWALANQIPVGPGRGSGAGSLVCYCLGITEVDPIRYGLYFERFLNPARISLPDIDVDFCPRGRKEVMRYVSERYGEGRVAQIGTYAAFKPRGSLRDFARVCGLEPRIGDSLAGLVPPDVAGFALSFDEVVKARPQLLTSEHRGVVDLARRAEGLKTKMGVHAAGVVISDRPIMEQLPLFRGRHDEIATQFDMHDVEDLGLVKYDFLGLINLTVIKDTIALVKELKDIDVEIEEGDQAVFKGVFQTGDLDGIFQFETSSGFRDLCVNVKPTSIEDLSAITALFRPGPLSTGLVTKYVSGSRGDKIEYSTPELEPILGDTYGVMVYQEQIMKICVELAGYTASEADDMRKAIGKKLADKMAQHKNKFVDGCIANNIDGTVASNMFNDIEGFARYSFNKAHSVAYSVISYRTAWLKHHYPEEFYCALFNNTISEKDQLIKYIHSCRDRGIPIEPPDVNRSAGLFTVDHGTIMFGLAGIKGVGEKACDHLLETRPEQGFTTMKELVDGKVNAGTLKALAASGSLNSMMSSMVDGNTSSQALTEAIPDLVKYYKKLEMWEARKIRYETREQEKKTAVEQGHKPPRSLPKLPPGPSSPVVEELPSSSQSSRNSKQLKLSMERATLGFYITGHPLDDFPGLYEKSKWDIGRIQEQGVPGTSVKIPVVISSIIKKRTKRGHDMGITIVEDRTGRIEATIFPKGWKKLKDIIEVDKVALATCKIDRNMMRNDEVSLVKLILEDVEILTEEDKDFYGEPAITNIEVKLKDGTRLVFEVNADTKIDLWQKAKAIATNLEGTL